MKIQHNLTPKITEMIEILTFNNSKKISATSRKDGGLDMLVFFEKNEIDFSSKEFPNSIAPISQTGYLGIEQIYHPKNPAYSSNNFSELRTFLNLAWIDKSAHKIIGHTNINCYILKEGVKFSYLPN